MMLTVNEAAARAGVSRRTIYNWIRKGQLPYKRTAGGGIRIDGESLFRSSPIVEARRAALPPFPIGPLLDPKYWKRL